MNDKDLNSEFNANLQIIENERMCLQIHPSSHTIIDSKFLNSTR